MIPRFVARLLLGLALAAGLVTAANTAPGGAPADGPWRVTMDLSSFFDGHLGTIDKVVELRNGTWDGTIRQGSMLVGMRITVAGTAVRGLLAVTAGRNWNSVSVPFDAVVVDGTVERRLTGPATYNLNTGFGRTDRQHRDVEIDLRLRRL
jgi:hypothetical protein